MDVPGGGAAPGDAIDERRGIGLSAYICSVIHQNYMPARMPISSLPPIYAAGMTGALTDQSVSAAICSKKEAPTRLRYKMSVKASDPRAHGCNCAGSRRYICMRTRSIAFHWL